MLTQLDLTDAINLGRRENLPIVTASQSPIYPTPRSSREQPCVAESSTSKDRVQKSREPSPEPIEYEYENDLFSPPYWAEDGLDIYPDEVDATINEFRNCTIRSDTLGKTNFSGELPDDASIKEFLRSTPLYDSRHRRWHKVPRECTDVQQLYRPFRTIVDAVCDHFGYAQSRPVVDSFHIPPTKLFFSEPHQLEGSRYRSEPLKRVPHLMALGLEGSNFGPLPSPFESGPSYTSMISPVEIQIDAKLNFHNDLAQLGLYARQCFMRQQNRMFVYTLLITETTVRLYMFDRSGVCYSRPYNIHVSAVDFVRILLGVWSPEDQDVGFDTTVYWEKNEGCVWYRYIESFDEDGDVHSYRLSQDDPLIDRWFIEGRGTTCWATTDNGRQLLIKDCWPDVARPSEAELLRGARNLQGVGQMIAAEDGDRISALRSIPAQSPHFVDRQFSRIILRNYGPVTIAGFQDRTDLLLGLRDAIAGHQRLWKRGILHGDISMDNILLTSRQALPGDRGVLIDLDMAMWVDPERAPSPVEFHNMGTRVYTSLNVLESYPMPPPNFSRDYLDDLESFYYLLCDICSTFTAPRERLPKPDFIRRWDHYNTPTAAASKMGTLLYPDYEVTPYFGRIFESLLGRLNDFFRKTAGRKRMLAARRRASGAPAPTWRQLQVSSEEDYIIVFQYIDQAIYELEFGRYTSATEEPAAYRSRVLSMAKLVPSPVVRLATIRPLQLARRPNFRKRAGDAEVAGAEEQSPKRLKTSGS